MAKDGLTTRLSPVAASTGIATLTPGAGPYKLQSHTRLEGIWDEWYRLRSDDGTHECPDDGTHERQGIHSLEVTFKFK